MSPLTEQEYSKICQIHGIKFIRVKTVNDLEKIRQIISQHKTIVRIENCTYVSRLTHRFSDEFVAQLNQDKAQRPNRGKYFNFEGVTYDIYHRPHYIAFNQGQIFNCNRMCQVPDGPWFKDWAEKWLRVGQNLEPSEEEYEDYRDLIVGEEDWLKSNHNADLWSLYFFLADIEQLRYCSGLERLINLANVIKDLKSLGKAE